MKLTDVFPTKYAANAVACKLWGILDSPIEFILDLAIFEKLADFQDGWRCRVYSEPEYRLNVAEPKDVHYPRLFALVPHLSIDEVGEVDLAILLPGLDKHRPVVTVECNGHEFHQRTVEQASNDRRRDRMLQRFGIPVLRFTGTDVVRGSDRFAQEVVDFISDRALPRVVSARR
jgi:hypothetical protein